MKSPPELSVVIPVYNGSQTIGSVVSRIHRSLSQVNFEIVLVNDGSQDNSSQICRSLAAAYQPAVLFLDLARNFGEHNAVLAGLAHSRGRAVAVLDDDCQNPPEEVQRMWQHLISGDLDVVYGRYVSKKHSRLRNLGSWFNDRMATAMLRKPAHIYLSSFKVMSRFLVDQIVSYRGPFPYIDGLIFRTTRRIAQIDVRHDERLTGRSGYTLRRLVRLWLNMFLGFSIAPLRLSILLGLATSVLSVLMIVGIVIDKLWINPAVPVGIPSVLACTTMFSGIQLIVLGTVGEYVGRIFLEQNGTPQFIVRDVYGGTSPGFPGRVPEMLHPELVTGAPDYQVTAIASAREKSNG